MARQNFVQRRGSRLHHGLLLSFFVGLLLIAPGLSANEADQRINQMILGEWVISGAVDENISGTGNVNFTPSGLADYRIEIYLNDYLLDRIESVFNWEVRAQKLYMTESMQAKSDPYGLRARARDEPVKVIGVNEQQLILQTERYGVLVLERAKN